MYGVGLRVRPRRNVAVSGMVSLLMRVGLVGMVLMAMRPMIVVRVPRLVRRRFPGNHIHLGPGDSAAAYLARFKPRAHPQRRSRLLKKRKRHSRIHQGAQQHIAAYAGKAFQITSSHRSVILTCRLRAAPRQHFYGEKRIH